MKRLPLSVLAGLVLVQGASAQEGGMRVVTPATTRWMPAPPSLPKGAQIAIISGDPDKPGPFAFRVRTPAGYRIALHTHPTAENLTMISGSIRHGMTARASEARTISAGDFLYLPPKMAHALWAGDRPAVIQVNGTGPFSITYIDPRDDPRRH